MTSDAQITANRNNARRSTGPRTAAGKRRSRMNAVCHGGYLTLTDEITSGLLNETFVEIEDIRDAIIEDLAPTSTLQYTQAAHIAQQIVNQQRIHRLTPILAEANDLGNSLDDVIGRARHEHTFYEQLIWTIETLDKPAVSAIPYLVYAELLHGLHHKKLRIEPPTVARDAQHPAEAERVELLRIIEAVYGPLPDALDQLVSRRDQLTSQADQEHRTALGIEAQNLLKTFEKTASIHDRVARSITRDLQTYRKLKLTENELIDSDDEDIDNGDSSGAETGPPRNEPNPIG